MICMNWILMATWMRSCRREQSRREQSMIAAMMAVPVAALCR